MTRCAATGLPSLLLLSLAVMSFAADDKVDRASLRGIKTLCLVVEVTDQAGSGLNQEQLQSEVQDRLRRAGIPIDKDATTCLYLNVRPLPAMGKNNKPVGLYAIDFKLEFMQAVTLARNPAIRAYASTWSLANLANVPAHDVESTTREIAVDLVNKFVRAYQSVNK